MAASPPATTPGRPPLSKTAVPLPYSLPLGRLAWWAWLTLDDDELAERLIACATPLPPWLDSRPWFLGGLLAGLVVGGLFGGLTFLAGQDDPLSGGFIAVYVALAIAGGVARRDRRGEVALQFPSRLAVLLLHLGYLALLLPAVAQALLYTVDDSGGTWVLTMGLALALLPWIWRASTPLLFVDDYDASWPALAGIDSLVLRALALGGLVTAAIMALPIWASVPVALLAVLAVSTMRAQERLAAAVAERIGGWPPARRVGRRAWIRRRFAPPPFALEALLLARPLSPDDWQLAADYCEARDYPPEALTAAVGRLWSGVPASRERARAAAWCALELWCNEQSTPEAAYRGFARIDALANQQPGVLDEPFWNDFVERAGDRPIRAQAIELLCERESALPVAGLAAWRLVRRLEWPSLLGHLDPEATRNLLRAVFGLVQRLRSPEALSELWLDFEFWAEKEGSIWGETNLVVLSSRANELTDEMLGGSVQVPANSHRLYPLALRHLAHQAAAAVSTASAPGLVGEWYEVARRFEALPEARQREVISPFGWWLLWRRVAEAVGDKEELARQEERYRKASRR